MRLFSAIELPDDVKAELADRLADARATAPDLTWIPPEQWHITVGFYGDGEDADRRGAWLREQVATLRGFQLRMAGAGRFSGVLWAGVEAPDGEHAAALQAVAGALTGRRAEGRTFTPHITVARWKQAHGPAAAVRATAALDGYGGRWWLADEVVLFRSERTPEGAVYTAVDRVALSGAPGKQR